MAVLRRHAALRGDAEIVEKVVIWGFFLDQLAPGGGPNGTKKQQAAPWEPRLIEYQLDLPPALLASAAGPGLLTVELYRGTDTTTRMGCAELLLVEPQRPAAHGGLPAWAAHLSTLCARIDGDAANAATAAEEMAGPSLVSASSRAADTLARSNALLESMASWACAAAHLLPFAHAGPGTSTQQTNTAQGAAQCLAEVAAGRALALCLRHGAWPAAEQASGTRPHAAVLFTSVCPPLPASLPP